MGCINGCMVKSNLVVSLVPYLNCSLHYQNELQKSETSKINSLALSKRMKNFKLVVVTDFILCKVARKSQNLKKLGNLAKII